MSDLNNELNNHRYRNQGINQQLGDIQQVQSHMHGNRADNYVEGRTRQWADLTRAAQNAGVEMTGEENLEFSVVNFEVRRNLDGFNIAAPVLTELGEREVFSYLDQEQRQDILQGFVGDSLRGKRENLLGLTYGRTGRSWAPMAQDVDLAAFLEVSGNEANLMGLNLDNMKQAITDIGGLVQGGASDRLDRVWDAVLEGRYKSDTVVDVETGETYAWGETSADKRAALFAKQGPQQDFLVKRYQALGGNIADLEGLDASAWQLDLIKKSNNLARANAEKRWWDTNTGIRGGVNKTLYFGSMLLTEITNDPDEVYLTLATAGLGTVTKIAAGGLRAGAEVALTGAMKGAAATGVANASRVALGSRLGRAARFLERHHELTSVSEFGGVITERIAANLLKAQAGRGIRWTGYTAGLVADGAIQGAAFYGANSAAMVDLATRLYGHSQGNDATMDGYVLSAVMGAGLSLGIGFGMRTIGSGYRAAMAKDRATFLESFQSGIDQWGATPTLGKSEADTLRTIYGENAPAGVSVEEATARVSVSLAESVYRLTGKTVDQHGKEGTDLTNLWGTFASAGIGLRDLADSLAIMAETQEGQLSVPEVISGLAYEVSRRPTRLPADNPAAQMVADLADAHGDAILELGAKTNQDPLVDPEATPEEQKAQRRQAQLERNDREQAKAKLLAEKAERAKKDAATTASATLERIDPETAPEPVVRRIAKDQGVEDAGTRPLAELRKSIDVEAANKQAADAKAARDAMSAERAAKLAAEAEARSAQADKELADIEDGKYEEKPYTPSLDKARDLKAAELQQGQNALTRYRDFLSQAEAHNAKNPDADPTLVDAHLLSKMGVMPEDKDAQVELFGEDLGGSITPERARALVEERLKELASEDASTVTPDELVDLGTRAGVTKPHAILTAPSETDVNLADGEPHRIANAATFRAAVVRTEAEGAALTLEARVAAEEKGVKYSKDADVNGILVALSRMGSLSTEAGNGLQSLSYDALKALFVGTSLQDLDISVVFQDAVINDVKGAEARLQLFGVQHVIDTLKDRLAAADPATLQARLDEVKGQAESNPYFLERRIIEAQAVARRRRARAERANNGGRLLGAENRNEWVAKAEAEYARLMPTTRRSNNTFAAVQERLGIRAEDFADGTVDYLDPTTFAAALADTALGRKEGTQYHTERALELNDEGVEVMVERESPIPVSINRAQPLTARQWQERFENAVAFHRRRAILDWDGSNADEVQAALENGELEKGTPLNPRKVHKFGGRLVPQELYTNPDTPFLSISEAIEQAQRDMLDLSQTDYDMIHDDFGTRPGQWSVPANWEDGRFFAFSGAAGGFPLATILPTADGSRSLGQAVLDAHTLLFPQVMWNARRAAMERGEAAAARGVEAYMGRNIDGAQNGVRHALAYAYAGEAEIQALLEKTVNKDVDFYVEVQTATLKALEQIAQGSDDRAAMARWWLENGPFREEKAGRKFSKQPVMTKPYGAGKRSLAGHIRRYFNDLDSPELGNLDGHELINFLTDIWHGNKREKQEGLLDKALGLPEADEYLARLAQRVIEGEPLTSRDDVSAMLERATQLEESTGVTADLWLTALHLNARAKAMGLDDARIGEIWAQDMQGLTDPMAMQARLAESGTPTLSLFEQVMAALGRSPVTLDKDPTGNAARTRRLTAQDSGAMDARLPGESMGKFYWPQMIDWRTRMYAYSNVLNPKSEKAGRHSLDLELLPEAEGFKLKDGKTEQDYQKAVSAVRRGEMTRDQLISEYVEFEGLGGNFRLADEAGAPPKREGLSESALEAEKERIRILVLKQIMLDASADFRPPVLAEDLDADGFAALDEAMDAKVMPRLERQLSNFQAASTDVQQAIVAHMGFPALHSVRRTARSRAEFEALPSEVRRSEQMAQGLFQLDTDMEARPLSLVQGVPHLALASKLASTRQTPGERQLLSTTDRKTQADALEARLSSLVGRTDLFSRSERHLVDHTSPELLPATPARLDLDSSLVAMSPEQEQALVRFELEQWAEQHGMAGQDLGRVWMARKFQEDAKVFDRTMADALRRARTPEAKEAIARTYRQRWQDYLNEARAEANKVLEGEWNTLTVDPAGAIKFVPGVDAAGNRLSVAEQLRRSSRSGGNVEAVTGYTSPLGLAEQPVDGLNPELATPPTFSEAFAEATGQPPLSREQNTKLGVHVVHGTDAAAIRLAVALREGLDPATAVGVQTAFMSVAEVEAGLQLGLIGGADANTRFFTKDGIEVVNPMIRGRNARRALTRSERHHIGLQTKNQALWRRLDLASKLNLDRLEVSGTRTLSSALDAERTDPAIQAKKRREQMEIRALRAMGVEAFEKAASYDSLSGAWNIHLGTMMDLTGNASLLQLALGPLQAKFAEMGFEFKLDSQDAFLDTARFLIGFAGKNEKGLVFRYMKDDPQDRKGDTPIPVSEIAAVVKKRVRDDAMADRLMVALGIDSGTPADATIAAKAVRAGFAKWKKAELAALQKWEANQLPMALADAEANPAVTVAALHALGGYNLETAKVLAGVTLETEGQMAAYLSAHRYFTLLQKQAGVWDYQGATGWATVEAAIKLIETQSLPLDASDMTPVQLREEAQRVKAHLNGLVGLADSASVDHIMLSMARARAALARETNPLVAKAKGTRHDWLTFTDTNGKPMAPEAFMNPEIYESLGEGHVQFNQFLEAGLEEGTIDIAAVRMLRVATAGLEDSFIASLGFGWADNSSQSDLATARGVYGRTFVSQGSIGIQIRRDTLASKGSMGLVDVLLHEIGHAGVETYIRTDSAAFATIRSMASSPEGLDAMRKMTTAMFGGKWSREAQQAFEYFTTGEHGVHEFMAQMFSFYMQGETLADHALLAQAFTPEPGTAGSLKSAVLDALKRIANYVFRRVLKIQSVLHTMDANTRAQVDSLAQMVAGRSTALPVEQFTPNMFDRRNRRPHTKNPQIAQQLETLQAKIDQGTATVDDVNEMFRLRAEGLSLDPMGIDPTTPGTLMDRLRGMYTNNEGDLEYARMKHDRDAVGRFVVEQLDGFLPEAYPADAPSIMGAVRAHGNFLGGMGDRVKAGVLAWTQYGKTIQSADNLTRVMASMIQPNTLFAARNPKTMKGLMSVQSVAEASKRAILPAKLAIQDLRRQVGNIEHPVRGRIDRVTRGARSYPDTARALERLMYMGLSANARELKSFQDKVFTYHLTWEQFVQAVEAGDISVEGVSLDTFRTYKPQLETAYKALHDLGTRVHALFDQNGTRSASRMPLIPFRLKKEAIEADPKAELEVKRMLADAFAEQYGEDLDAGVIRDALPLQLLGFLPASDSTADLASFWNRLQVRRRNLGDSSKDLAVERDIHNVIREDARTASELHGMSAVAAFEMRLRDFEGDTNYREDVLRRWFAAKKQEISNRMDGDKMVPIQSLVEDSERGLLRDILTNRELYVEEARSLLQVRDNNGNLISSATDLRSMWGSTAFEMTQRTGRFLNLEGSSMARLVRRPEFQRYIDHDMSTILRGMQKGPLFDELSKEAVHKALGVKGMSHKDIVEMTRDYVSAHNNNSVQREVDAAFRYYDEAIEHAAGRRSSFTASTGHVVEFLARNGTSLAMLFYGRNLGLAQLAETTQAAANHIRVGRDINGGLLSTLGDMFSMVGSKRRRELAKNLVFALAHIDDEINTRVVNGVRGDEFDNAQDGWFTRFLERLGNTTTRLGGAFVIQRFNKTYAAYQGIRSQVADADAALALSDLMAQRDGEISRKEFIAMARQAGFGRRWSDALRWANAGLLEPSRVRAARKLIMENLHQADKGIWDVELARSRAYATAELQSGDARTSPGAAEELARRDAFEALMSMTESYVNLINVEPQLLDQNMNDSSRAAWSRVMDTFLAWPRAFFAQRIGSRSQYSNAEFYTLISSQYLFDFLYRAVRSLAGGSLGAELVHEMTKDPVGFLLEGATAVPFLGGWSGVSEIAVNLLRDQAAGRVPGFGYSDPRVWNQNFGGSPVTATVNRLYQMVASQSRAIGRLAAGEDGFADYAHLTGWQLSNFLPGVNSVVVQAFMNALANPEETKSYSQRGFTRYMDYLDALHKRRAMERR